MRMWLGRLEVRVHPLLPAVMMLYACVGELSGFLTAFACMLLHEMGHLTAAKILGVPALSLEIMPMGGVLHIGGLYRLSGRKIACIAIAGPLVSFALTVIGILNPQHFPVGFVAVNLILFLLNILPGLPLDGGRLLAALLKRPLGIRRSVLIAVWSGRIIGAGLILLPLIAGRMSFLSIILGIYILATADREREICENTPLTDMAQLIAASRYRQSMPVQAVIIDESMGENELLRQLRADRCTLLLDETGAIRMTDSQWLRQKIRS